MLDPELIPAIGGIQLIMPLVMSALGMLAASEQIETDQLDNFIAVGELALTGAVRSCKGVLPVALRAKAEGKIGVLVPAENAAEARSCRRCFGSVQASDH